MAIPRQVTPEVQARIAAIVAQLSQGLSPKEIATDLNLDPGVIYYTLNLAVNLKGYKTTAHMMYELGKADGKADVTPPQPPAPQDQP